MANVTSHSLREKMEHQQSAAVPSLAGFNDESGGTSPRQYMGEPWARQLIAWLERNQLKAKGKRIVELLREMSSAAGMVQPDWTLDAQWGMTCELRKGAVDPTFTAF